MKRACLFGRISIVKSFVTVVKLPVTDDLVFSGIMPKNSVEMTGFLLQNGGNITARSADNVNLLQYAACHKKYDVVKFLLVEYPKEFDILLEELDDVLILELLLILDSKRHVKSFMKRVQPQKYFNDKHLIHIAAEIGTVETLRTIVAKNKEDLKEEDKNGYNALHFAALGNSKNNLRYLIRKGIQPGCETREGINILDISAFKGHDELLEFITRKYMNNHFLNNTNRVGWNALHFAAYGNSLRCLETLIQTGFQPDSCTSDGKNILHIAVERNNLGVIEYILKRNFELAYLRNDLGQTPYDLVQDNMHMKQLFKEYDLAHFTFERQTEDETQELVDSDLFPNLSVQTQESIVDLHRQVHLSSNPHGSQRTRESTSDQELREDYSQHINTSESSRCTSERFSLRKLCTCSDNEP